MSELQQVTAQLSLSPRGLWQGREGVVCPQHLSQPHSALRKPLCAQHPLCAQREGTQQWDGAWLLGGGSCPKSSQKALWLVGKCGTDLFCTMLVASRPCKQHMGCLPYVSTWSPSSTQSPADAAGDRDSPSHPHGKGCAVGGVTQPIARKHPITSANPFAEGILQCHCPRSPGTQQQDKDRPFGRIQPAGHISAEAGKTFISAPKCLVPLWRLHQQKGPSAISRVETQQGAGECGETLVWPKSTARGASGHHGAGTERGHVRTWPHENCSIPQRSHRHCEGTPKFPSFV